MFPVEQVTCALFVISSDLLIKKSSLSNSIPSNVIFKLGNGLDIFAIKKEGSTC